MNQEKTFLPFQSAAVLGAGVMGAQIAAHLANAGLEVQLLDIAPKEGRKNAIVEAAFKKTLKMKPNPFAYKAAAGRITLGNFDEHLDRIKNVEWIIEVVIENLAIKQNLMEKIENLAAEDTIITSNTSGLPIHQITEGRSAAFKKRFMGTHFFNPPRYLKLLEIIPTPDTDTQLLEKIKWFGRVHLGKSVVIAKDTPNFIANRIGNYASLQAIRGFTEKGYTIEEIDMLTGTLTGHAKSATFRTADVVGLDTLLYVADNLYEAIPHDESREAHKAPELLRQLVERKHLGAKVRKGFYSKVGKDILSINPTTFEYEAPKPLDLGDTKAYKKISNLPERLKAIYEDTGRAGAFFRESNLDLIGYCARRIPEIADSPADIDNATSWGFAWEIGPFQVWDAIGFDRVIDDMKKMGIALPDWVDKMKAEGADSFYRDNNGQKEVYVPGKGYVALPEEADRLSLTEVAAEADNVIFEQKECALLDIGNGVALLEFRSKSNSLGSDVVKGILRAIDTVEQGPWNGLVIGNEGRNFSVGANLGEAAFAMMAGQQEMVFKAVDTFQDMIQRIRYARKPVVAAVQGMALGGGCEIALACANVCAALESYVGLVELGAGLIPAGTGATTLTACSASRVEGAFSSQIQPVLLQAFQNIATAKVSTSAHEAIEMGYLPAQTRVVMHADRRIFVAREEVLRLANQGYMPPPRKSNITVLGAPARAAMSAAVYQMKEAGFASEYDGYLADKLAFIMTGGDLSGPASVDENYLLKLEREAFVELLQQKKTLERIESILKTNKPLRN